MLSVNLIPRPAIFFGCMKESHSFCVTENGAGLGMRIAVSHTVAMPCTECDH